MKRIVGGKKGYGIDRGTKTKKEDKKKKPR
jgi:hypothetical protein